jgi:Ninjurin
LDANKYATKKTIAQGMLDIALLTANASQLKYVLQLGYRHEFYQIMIVLISSSIVLQVSHNPFVQRRAGHDGTTNICKFLFER